MIAFREYIVVVFALNRITLNWFLLPKEGPAEAMWIESHWLVEFPQTARMAQPFSQSGASAIGVALEAASRAHAGRRTLQLASRY